MHGELFLGAYWSARRESIDECADRLQRFFAELIVCDPALSTWYETGRSRSQSLEMQVNVKDRNALLNILNKGRHWTDIGRELVEDLGFGIRLWNGSDDRKDAGVGVACGSYWVSDEPTVSVSNCVTVNFPEDLGELHNADRMSRVLSVVATAWEPDWAGVMSREAMDARNFDAANPFVDWMVYLSKDLLPQRPQLPPPSVVEEINAIGSIVVVQQSPPDPNNSEHLNNIRQVEAALAR